MQKLKYLDGLRGLAALIVVISHFVVAFYPSLYNGSIDSVHTQKNLELWISKSPINLFYNGNFAVCVFFVLSGYVLSYKFFITRDKEFIVKSAVKRYFRLVFPVFISIILIFLMMKLSLFYNKEAAVLTFSEWWLGGFWNFEPTFRHAIKNALLDVFFSHDSSYNTVLWTMSYELYGSFLIFSFIALFGTIKRRYFFYIILIFLFRDTIYLGFILGLMLADLKYSIHLFDKRFFGNYFLKLFFILFGLYIGSYPIGAPVDNSIYSYIKTDDYNTIVFYHIIGAFLVVLAVLISNKLQSFFSHKILYSLGKISFSLYLIHVIVIGSFTSWSFVNLTKYFSYSISVIISSIFSIPLLFLLSILLYKYADKVGIKLSNKVYLIITKSV